MTLFLLYVFILTLQIILSVSGEYFVIPNAEIIAYSPRGLEISIPDEDGMVLFAIHANINREMNHLEAGEISQDVTRKINNRWVYRNKNIRLKVGDTLYYWLFVIKDGLGYRRDDITHVVEGKITFRLITVSIRMYVQILHCSSESSAGNTLLQRTCRKLKLEKQNIKLPNY